MGPGSVSSLLKTALDVFYVALWALIGTLALSAVLFLFVQFDRTATYRDCEFAATIHIRGAVASLILIALSAYFGIILFIVDRLRRLFLTLVAGDPFHPGNVNRIRAIGVGLALLEAANIARHVGVPLLLTGDLRWDRGWPDLTAWFAVLVVFVVAEVFREGGRLRREAELTI
jgi:hypothetical protein